MNPLMDGSGIWMTPVPPAGDDVGTGEGVAPGSGLATGPGETRGAGDAGGTERAIDAAGPATPITNSTSVERTNQGRTITSISLGAVREPAVES